MAALEAAACGLPIAGPRIGVLADLPEVESEYAAGQTAGHLATLYASVTTIESGTGVPGTARAPEHLS